MKNSKRTLFRALSDLPELLLIEKSLRKVIIGFWVADEVALGHFGRWDGCLASYFGTNGTRSQTPDPIPFPSVPKTLEIDPGDIFLTPGVDFHGMITHGVQKPYRRYGHIQFPSGEAPCRSLSLKSHHWYA